MAGPQRPQLMGGRLLGPQAGARKSVVREEGHSIYTSIPTIKPLGIDIAVDELVHCLSPGTAPERRRAPRATRVHDTRDSELHPTQSVKCELRELHTNDPGIFEHANLGDVEAEVMRHHA